PSRCLSGAARPHPPMAVMGAEYGGSDGILTMGDMMEELIGDLRDEYDPVEPRRADGTYDAGITIEDFTTATGVELADGPYETVAGYVLTQLGRLARPGDRVQVNGSTLEVARVEGKRIRVVRIIDTAPQHSPACPRRQFRVAIDTRRGRAPS